MWQTIYDELPSPQVSKKLKLGFSWINARVSMSFTSPCSVDFDKSSTVNGTLRFDWSLSVTWEQCDKTFIQ